MPADAAVVGEAVERAVRVEGLVVGAKPDAGVLRDEPEELLPGALLGAAVGAFGKLHLHELELALPFVDEVCLERLQLVQGDEVVLDPQGALGIRAVVVDHRLLQELCGERDPAQLLDERAVRVGLLDVEVDVLAPDERGEVVAGERVAELVDLRLDVQGGDGAARAAEAALTARRCHQPQSWSMNVCSWSFGRTR